jgi:prevent-host-death family protein
VTEVNIHEAKTHLSRLLRMVLLGEEIIIAKAGKRVARIVPYRESKANRTPGLDRGLFAVPEGFDAPLPEDVQRGFEQ